MASDVLRPSEPMSPAGKLAAGGGDLSARSSIKLIPYKAGPTFLSSTTGGPGVAAEFVSGSSGTWSAAEQGTFGKGTGTLHGTGRRAFPPIDELLSPRPFQAPEPYSPAGQPPAHSQAAGPLSQASSNSPQPSSPFGTLPRPPPSVSSVPSGSLGAGDPSCSAASLTDPGGFSYVSATAQPGPHTHPTHVATPRYGTATQGGQSPSPTHRAPFGSIFSDLDCAVHALPGGGFGAGPSAASPHLLPGITLPACLPTSGAQTPASGCGGGPVASPMRGTVGSGHGSPSPTRTAGRMGAGGTPLHFGVVRSSGNGGACGSGVGAGGGPGSSSPHSSLSRVDSVDALKSQFESLVHRPPTPLTGQEQVAHVSRHFSQSTRRRVSRFATHFDEALLEGSASTRGHSIDGGSNPDATQCSPVKRDLARKSMPCSLDGSHKETGAPVAGSGASRQEPTATPTPPLPASMALPPPNQDALTSFMAGFS